MSNTNNEIQDQQHHQQQHDQPRLPAVAVDGWKESFPPPNIVIWDPVRQLDDYLEGCCIPSRCPQQTSSVSTSNNPQLPQQSQQQNDDKTESFIIVDDILRVAEFLFGANMLQASLLLLDSSSTNITKLSTATSHRSLYVVNGSSSFSSSSSNHHGNSAEQSSYMCILGRHNNRACDDGASTSCYSRPVEYCSCRSFLEKSIKNSNTFSEGGGRNQTQHRSMGVICKHLLALKLMPYLMNSTTTACPQITMNTEKEFANLVMARTFGTE